MTTKLVKLLSIVCVAFLLLIAGEWFYVDQTQHQLFATSTNVKVEEYQPDEMPTLDLTEQTEDNYVDLVERPLFIKGRKPVEEVVNTETQQVQAVTEVPFDWQLSGVYSGKKGMTALFSRTKTRMPKDNYRRLTKGGDLDGWKLTILDNDKVLLKQGSTEKQLLLRKPKEKPPAIPGQPMPGQMPQARLSAPQPPPIVPPPNIVATPPPEPPNVTIEPPQDPFETTNNE